MGGRWHEGAAVGGLDVVELADILPGEAAGADGGMGAEEAEESCIVNGVFETLVGRLEWKTNGNPDGLRSLTKYSKLPVERINYLPDADEKVVRMIGRGILFQMALWSIPAVKAFAKLTEVISKLDQEGVIELIVVDIDGSAALSAASEFLGRCSGSRRNVWVRNGSIIATTGRGLNIECFEHNTRWLLAMV